MTKIPAADVLGVVEPKFTGQDRVSISSGEMSAITAPGRTLADVGQFVQRQGEQWSAHVRAEQEKADDYTTKAAVLDLGADADAIYAEERKNMPAGGQGFAQRVTERFDEAARTKFSTIPASQRAKANHAFLQQRYSIMRRAADDEERENDHYQSVEVDSRLSRLETDVEADPESLETKRAAAEDYVSSSFLTNRGKDDRLRGTKSVQARMERAAINGVLRQANELYIEANRISSTDPQRSAELIERSTAILDKYQGLVRKSPVGGSESERLSENGPKGLGWVSGKYESGNRGVGMISSGSGDPGGASYGRHQLSSTSAGGGDGSMGAFLRSPEGQQFRDRFRGLAPGTSGFNNAYRQVVREQGQEFEKAQFEFMHRTHYLPRLEAAKARGFDVDNPGVKEAIFSIGVQHAGAEKIIDLAVGKARTAEEQIRALYEARRNYVMGVEMRPDVKRSVLNRYRDEEQDALRAARMPADPQQAERKPAGPQSRTVEQIDAEIKAHEAKRLEIGDWDTDAATFWDWQAQKLIDERRQTIPRSEALAGLPRHVQDHLGSEARRNPHQSLSDVLTQAQIDKLRERHPEFTPDSKLSDVENTTGAFRESEKRAFTEADDARFRYLTSEQRRKADNQITALRSQILAGVREEMKRQIGSHIDSIKDTGTGIEDFSMDAARKLLTPNQIRAYEARIEDAKFQYEVTNGSGEMSKSELDRRLESLQPKPGTDDYGPRMKIWRNAARHVNQIIEKRRTDSGGSFDRNPAVAAAIGLAEKLEANKERAPWKGVVDARYEAQRRAEVPEQLLRPVPKSEALGYATQLRGVDMRDMKQAMEDMGTKITEKYGREHAGAVLYQVLDASHGEVKGFLDGYIAQQIREGRIDRRSISRMLGTIQSDRSLLTRPDDGPGLQPGDPQVDKFRQQPSWRSWFGGSPSPSGSAARPAAPQSTAPPDKVNALRKAIEENPKHAQTIINEFVSIYGRAAVPVELRR